MPITREQKNELVLRSLGLKHKLKVHDSMKSSETHEDMAHSLMARWELEDELSAIEQLLNEARLDNIEDKKSHLEKEYLGKGSAKAKKK